MEDLDNGLASYSDQEKFEEKLSPQKSNQKQQADPSVSRPKPKVVQAVEAVEEKLDEVGMGLIEDEDKKAEPEPEEELKRESKES